MGREFSSIFFLLIAAQFTAGNFARAEELYRRPATVVSIHHNDPSVGPYDCIKLVIDAKPYGHDQPHEAFLLIRGTKYIYVLATGQRKDATEDAVKPGMHVLVTGFLAGVSGFSVAKEVDIVEKKP